MTYYKGWHGKRFLIQRIVLIWTKEMNPRGMDLFRMTLLTVISHGYSSFSERLVFFRGHKEIELFKKITNGKRQWYMLGNMTCLMNNCSRWLIAERIQKWHNYCQTYPLFTSPFLPSIIWMPQFLWGTCALCFSPLEHLVKCS